MGHRLSGKIVYNVYLEKFLIICFSEFFAKKDAIYFPSQNPDDSHWVELETCIWDGPPYMESKFPLKPRCSSIGVDVEDFAFKSFFRDTLGVPSITWHDLTDELEHIQGSENACFDNITDIYRRLYGFKDDKDWPGELR